MTQKFLPTHRSFGLRGKLVAVITVPMIVLNALALFVFTSSRIQQTKESMIWNTQSIIRAMEQDFERLYHTGDQHLATDLVDRIAAFERVEGVVVWKPGGDVIFAYDRTGSPHVSENLSQERTRFSANTLSVVQPLKSGGREFAVAEFYVSTVELAHEISRSVVLTLLVGLATAALGVVIACMLQQVISQPILELKDTAQAVLESDDYSIRAVNYSADEIGVLTDAFNNMLAHIEQSDEALRQTNELLETRIAERTANLREVNRDLEQEIVNHRNTQRERERLYGELLSASHRAGMAEVATGVMHNVGNVLNSVNVSVGLLVRQNQSSRVDKLNRAVALIEQHRGNLAEFLTGDERGMHFLDYLKEVVAALYAENALQREELDSLVRNVAHVKEIIYMQQSYAQLGGVMEPVNLTDLIEDALKINEAALVRHSVQVTREFDNIPPVAVDRHKVLQILVNLISNAKYALDGCESDDKRITLVLAADDECVQIEVRDNGAGIAQENFAKIFRHGFTTREEGHGFGLHSSALAAKELGGSLTAQSDGLGSGATFTLTIPLVAPEMKARDDATLQEACG